MINDPLRITGPRTGSPLHGPQPTGKTPPKPQVEGSEEGDGATRHPQDCASITTRKNTTAARPAALIREDGEVSTPTGREVSSSPGRVETSARSGEVLSTCLFVDEFPQPSFGLPAESTSPARPPGGSITDGIWDWWCDSLNLGTALKRLLGKTRNNVEGAAGDYARRGRKGIEEISKQVGDYQKTTSQSLAGIRKAANQLADSPRRELRDIGNAALKLTRQVQPTLSRLPGPVNGLERILGDSEKTITRGAELIKSGIAHIPVGGDEPLTMLYDGRNILRQGLEASREGGGKHAPELLGILERLTTAANGFLTSSGRKPGNLSKEDRARVETVIGESQKLLKGAERIRKTAQPLAELLGEDSGQVASKVDYGLNQLWNRIARDADNVPLDFTCIHRATKDFILGTNDFRTVLGAARRGDDRAIARLEEGWGFTPRNLPPENTLFIDPAYGEAEVRKGRISAAQFPAANPVQNPPDLETQLFADGRKLTLPDNSGKEATIGNMREYRDFLADYRKTALGNRSLPSEPRQVHLAMRGGGGLGKRYAPAMYELYRLGVVPSSLSGTSAGSIAAAIMAAGADPAFLEKFLGDDRIAKMYDVKLGGGGLLKGEVAYQLFDDTLRELTGIKDRPVTFADLKMPLHVVAVKYADSDPPPEQADMGKWENRLFVFGPETTPNTPVALAIRASIAIPGVFEPVEMVDPTTGRTLLLADGGVLDNLPLGYNRDHLPTVALNLGKQNRNHPDDILNNLPTRSIPKDQLYAGNPVLNALYSGLLYAFSGRNDRDYQERFNPPPGNFVFNIPTWNINAPSQGDSELNFAYDPKIDPELDIQTHELTRKFFREHFQNLTVPGAHGTNLKPLPEKARFERTFEHNGLKWKARYEGSGDHVLLTNESDQEYTLKVGRKNLENWILDDSAFGDLKGRIREAVAAGRHKEIVDTPAPIKDNL